MNHYTISLTVTDESSNVQIVHIRTPHLTGKQAKDLVDIGMAGVLIEPEPEVLTTLKPAKKRSMFKRKKAEPVQAPVGFTNKELENL